MRLMPVLFAALVTACTSPSSMEVHAGAAMLPTAAAPAPVEPFTLDADVLVPGAPFVVSVARAPGTRVFLFGSPAGTGAGMCQGPVCLEIAAPNVLIGSATADASGIARVVVAGAATARLPIGGQVWLQAASSLRRRGVTTFGLSDVLRRVAGDLDLDLVAPPADCDDTDPVLTGADLDGDGANDCEDPCPDDALDACLCGPGREPDGAGGCSVCAAGTASASGVACAPCDRGTFASVEGAASCVPCAAGRFADLEGQVTCTPCAPGSAAPDAGSLSCALCEPGTASSVDGAVACAPCSLGTFTDVVGSEDCSVCEPFTYTPEVGALACELCPEGTYLDGGICLTCPEGAQCQGGGLNLPPWVEISEPVEGATFTELDTITLIGSAVDVEEGDLSSSLAWSLLDLGDPVGMPTPIGTGAHVDLGPLAPGAYEVRAAATDSSDASASSAVTIAVNACGLTAALSPPGGLRLPQTLQLDASASADSCGRSLQFYWQCTSSTSSYCPTFLAAANAGGNTTAAVPLLLNELDSFDIVLKVCIAGSAEGECAPPLTRQYNGAEVTPAL